MKKIVKEAEKKDKIWEENKHQLDITITLACNSFVDEGIAHKKFSKAKVFRICEIA